MSKCQILHSPSFNMDRSVVCLDTSSWHVPCTTMPTHGKCSLSRRQVGQFVTTSVTSITCRLTSRLARGTAHGPFPQSPATRSTEITQRLVSPTQPLPYEIGRVTAPLTGLSALQYCGTRGPDCSYTEQGTSRDRTTLDLDLSPTRPDTNRTSATRPNTTQSDPT